jgi:hypothetical protein
VVCRCRPDQHRWRAFGLLSGGQKALSTLALVLALQAALPSAFYFFDEVRAAERLCWAAPLCCPPASRAPQVGAPSMLDTQVAGLVTCAVYGCYRQTRCLSGSCYHAAAVLQLLLLLPPVLLGNRSNILALRLPQVTTPSNRRLQATKPTLNRKFVTCMRNEHAVVSMRNVLRLRGQRIACRTCGSRDLSCK